mgnify:CR=1 FL=1
MASTRATNALKSYIAQSVARNETVTFDKIIFAHISGLNDATLANINNMPTADQIKHTANIQQTGYIADDQVVYSVTLGSEIGDFTFNFVGLVNSAKNVLGVAIYTGDIVKTRTKAEEQGNALTRNIILQINNAKTLTNIQIQAKAWQFDFTDKFLQMKPKKITATTTNTADSSGHTHEIDKASTTQSGVVQLVDDWTTHDNRKALTASTGKRLYDTLKGLIDNLSNTAANALSKTTPKKITATTTNATDQNGHTHEIDKASTSIAGVVKLNDSLTSNATDEALTARQGKVLNDKIVYSSETLMRYIRDVDNLLQQQRKALDENDQILKRHIDSLTNTLQQKWEALNDKVTNLNSNIEIANMEISSSSLGVGFKDYTAVYTAPARNYRRVSSLGDIVEAGHAYSRTASSGAISINNSPNFDAVLLFPIKDKP